MRLTEVLESTGLMDHCIRVTDVPDRGLWLAELCRGRSVLHVGCCDVPIFDPNNNLHISLSRCATRLDGLDISEEGILELKRHVAGNYFTSPDQATESYDLVLVPEVLEHTPNARAFLDGIFGICARRYLVTAPNIEWFAQTRRSGDLFHEQVHGDHRAWYSPYTLLNTLRPYINEAEDEIEVFLIQKVGSVAVLIDKPGQTLARITETEPKSDAAQDALHRVGALRDAGKTAEALALLAQIRQRDLRIELYYVESEILLALGRHLDAFRSGVAFLREHPNDSRCLRYCAAASEALGDPQQAQQLRARADRCDAEAQRQKPLHNQSFDKKRRRRK